MGRGRSEENFEKINMPIWVIYLASLLSFVLIGASLGGVHKLLKGLDLFSSFKGKRQKLTHILISITILFPLWSFFFGFFGSNYGLTPAQAPVWIAAIGVGLAIFVYEWINGSDSTY